METVKNRVFGEVIHLILKGGPDLMSEIFKRRVTASVTSWIYQKSKYQQMLTIQDFYIPNCTLIIVF